MPYVDAGDLHVHYQDDYFGARWQQSPPVFLLQAGYGANSNHFATWLPGLADSFRVIRRDAVGHGLTNAGSPGRDLSLPALAQDVIAFMDALGLERVHYLGERTGAMTGAVLAAEYPERLHSLTLFGCPIACGQGLQDAMWAMLAPDLQSKYTGWNDALTGLGGAFAWHDHVHWLERPRNDAHNTWQRAQLHLCDEALLERYAEATKQYDITEYLPKISVPTLILGPTDTYRTNLEQQVAIRSSIPNSELEIVERSVGRADDDVAPRLARRVRRFLAERVDS
jgi:pimeloyl-ACP methyl ester carboxylesterase